MKISLPLFRLEYYAINHLRNIGKLVFCYRTVEFNYGSGSAEYINHGNQIILMVLNAF